MSQLYETKPPHQLVARPMAALLLAFSFGCGGRVVFDQGSPGKGGSSGATAGTTLSTTAGVATTNASTTVGGCDSNHCQPVPCGTDANYNICGANEVCCKTEGPDKCIPATETCPGQILGCLASFNCEVGELCCGPIAETGETACTTSCTQPGTTRYCMNDDECTYWCVKSSPVFKFGTCM